MSNASKVKAFDRLVRYIDCRVIELRRCIDEWDMNETHRSFLEGKLAEVRNTGEMAQEFLAYYERNE